MFIINVILSVCVSNGVLIFMDEILNFSIVNAWLPHGKHLPAWFQLE